jgi:outer membrane protein
MKLHLTILYLLCAGAIMCSLVHPFSPRIAYVDPGELYDSFHMRKQLESRLAATEQARKNTLDSLMSELKVIQDDISHQKKRNEEDVRTLSLLQKSYMMKQEQFKREVESMSDKYNSEVYAQINEYVKDYGSNKGYKYILGANGQGSLMYAVEGDNITKDMIQYINERYDGKGK